MQFSKFNNRPPFERKKPTEFCDVIRSYPENCCREPNNMSKSSKLLENSRKTSPSIQTLYRRNNSKLTGRNVPKHNLMKKLLQNFNNNDSSDNGGKKKKKFFVQNEVIRTDFEVNCKNRKNDDDCKVKAKSNRKIDQQTSTTGLFAETGCCCNCCDKKSSKIVAEISKSDKLLPIISRKSLRSEQNILRTKITKRRDTDAPVAQKSKSTINSNNKKKNVNRGKTFVQIQVEKLDKQLKFNANNVGKSDAAATYLELMNKVKNACPQLHQLPLDPVKSDGDWSDYSILEEEFVKFPKETRTAMDRRLYETRRPLSKFTMVQHCRPAVEIVCRNDDRCFGDSCREVADDTKMSKFTRETKYRVINKKSKLSMPCKRNLLCDKGECHAGACGYTYCNRNKVIY